MNESQKYPLNPYTAGRPVFGDRFFGRDKVFQTIREALVTSQQRLVVLHGQRRIGKTSILQELREKLPVGNFAIVNFDLQFYAGQELPKVLSGLAQAIAHKFELPSPNRSDFEKEVFFENTFLKVVEQHLVKNQRLLILIDEFDIIRETERGGVPVASYEFAALLQRLINNKENLCFLLVAGSHLTFPPTHLQSVFRLGATVRVSFFDEEEVHQLITAPAEEILNYSDEAVETIYKLTSGHPYFTQLLCFEIF